MKYKIFVIRGVHPDGKKYDIYVVMDGQNKIGMLIQNWGKVTLSGRCNLKNALWSRVKRQAEIRANYKTKNGYVFQPIRTILDTDDHERFRMELYNRFRPLMNNDIYGQLMTHFGFSETGKRVDSIQETQVIFDELVEAYESEEPKQDSRFTTDPLWGCW